MKKLSSVFAAAALILVAAGCRQAALPTVEGRVVDATIHSVTIQTAEGESVVLSTRGTDPMLVPGVLAGDVVKVAYEVLPEGEALQTVRLDITTPSAYRLVPGIWRDCSGTDEIGLVLAEDGSAQVVGLRDLSLQTWTLDGENLVLDATDPTAPKEAKTLIWQIEKLDADSLIVRAAGEEARRLVFSRSE